MITDVEKEAFKLAFDEYDLNKDGHITIKELKLVMNKLGQNPSDEDVTNFMQECDVDENGTIEFDEFCQYLVRHRREVRASALLE